MTKSAKTSRGGSVVVVVDDEVVGVDEVVVVGGIVVVAAAVVLVAGGTGAVVVVVVITMTMMILTWLPLRAAAAVAATDSEDDDDNEFFMLEFESRQDERDRDLKYQMRVTVQLNDKKTKKVVYAQTTYEPPELPPNDHYADHTAWEFRIPFWMFLKRPKLEAYIIEFVIIENGKNIPSRLCCLLFIIKNPPNAANTIPISKG